MRRASALTSWRCAISPLWSASHISPISSATTTRRLRGSRRGGVRLARGHAPARGQALGLGRRGVGPALLLARAATPEQTAAIGRQAGGACFCSSIQTTSHAPRGDAVARGALSRSAAPGKLRNSAGRQPGIYAAHRAPRGADGPASSETMALPPARRSRRRRVGRRAGSRVRLRRGGAAPGVS